MVEQNPVAPNVAVPSLQGPRSDRHLSSLREYLDALRDLGELQEIAREVDWNLEIGAVPKVWDRVMTSEDAREGIQSFVERPAAVFPRMLIDDLSREWTK
jgi:hypothetical protein